VRPVQKPVLNIIVPSIFNFPHRAAVGIHPFEVISCQHPLDFLYSRKEIGDFSGSKICKSLNVSVRNYKYMAREDGFDIDQSIA
jgi:hypothetical protein